MVWLSPKDLIRFVLLKCCLIIISNNKMNFAERLTNSLAKKQE
jgi:hypothetical protein